MFKSSRNQHGHAAFTVKENNTLREIITDCQVSMAFAAKSNPFTKHPPLVDSKALWDTGATNSAITKRLIDKLGILPFTNVDVNHADGVTKKDVYKVNIILPNGVGFQLMNVTEFSGVSGNFDLLIGMDIITSGDFAITNKDGKTVVSFRTPSNCEIDFNDGETTIIPASKNAATPPKPINTLTNSSAIPVVPRNQMCPCGSGKKYKHCHGKAA